LDRFEEFLKGFQGGRIVVLSPGGNHGDTLIHMGLAKKLGELDIEFDFISLETLYRRSLGVALKYVLGLALWELGAPRRIRVLQVPEEVDLVLLEGGGYMCDYWYGAWFLNQAKPRGPTPIAIGPQSYHFKKTEFPQHLTDSREYHLFCREKPSLHHLTQLGLPPNTSVYLSPDTALYLEKEDLEPYIEPLEGGYDLFAFRKDRESLLSAQQRQTLVDGSDNPLVADISKRGSLTEFITTIFHAHHVFTDRLHVAIAAKVLGRPATLFPNRYHKNRGVWEYSLAGHVEFSEPPQ